jgi:TPR repeat protein
MLRRCIGFKKVTANGESDAATDAQNHAGLIYLNAYDNGIKVYDTDLHCYAKLANDMEKFYAQNEPLSRVKLDYKKAFMNFTKSANNGYTSGFSNSGYLYLKGYGTDKDYEQAFLWYTRAIDRGANNVFILLDQHILMADMVLKEITKRLLLGSQKEQTVTTLIQSLVWVNCIDIVLTKSKITKSRCFGMQRQQKVGMRLQNITLDGFIKRVFMLEEIIWKL